MTSLLVATATLLLQTPATTVGGFATEVLGKVTVVRGGTTRKLTQSAFLQVGDVVNVASGTVTIASLGQPIRILMSGESEVIEGNGTSGFRQADLDIVSSQLRQAAAEWQGKDVLDFLPSGPFAFSLARGTAVVTKPTVKWLPVEGAANYTLTIRRGEREVWTQRVSANEANVSESLSPGTYDLTVAAWRSDLKSLAGVPVRTQFDVALPADVAAQSKEIADAQSLAAPKVANVVLMCRLREARRLGEALEICSTIYNRSVKFGNPDPVLAAYAIDLLSRMGAVQKPEDPNRSIKAESRRLPFAP